MRHWEAWFVGACLASAACQSRVDDAPPPEEKLEVAKAAPGAVGALAAGTEMAPPVARQPREPVRTWQVPGDELDDEPPEFEQDADGGAESEGGLGSAEPERVPL